MMRTLAAAAALVLAAGCSVLAPSRPGEPERKSPTMSSLFSHSSADEVVAYLARLRGLGESALAAEATRQRALAQREGGDLARVKAAIAITLTNPADETDLLAMLEPVARKPAGDADLRAVASFLQALASDRRRLRESAAAGSARLREGARALEAQKQRADGLQERVTQLQERAAQLQQKLDALTEIEKSLSDRQPTSR